MSRCRSCATLYAIGTDAETAEDYGLYCSDCDRDVPDAIRKSLTRTVQSFEPYRRHNRLLDVGFGRGDLLEEATRLGWQVSGTEVAIEATRNGRAKGFDVFHGPLEDAPFEEERFDVVTAIEVVEHVPRPASLTSAMCRVLRPGGLLWITTPHGRGLSARLLGLRWEVIAPPEHLQLFSIAGLSRLLTASGFQVARLHAQSVNPVVLMDGILRRPGRHERLCSGRQLLEATSRGHVLPIAVRTAQAGLRGSQLGDSLRAWAVKKARSESEL